MPYFRFLGNKAFWAGLTSSTIIASWILAGFGVAQFLELWDQSGGSIVTYGISIVGLLLGYNAFQRTSFNVNGRRLDDGPPNDLDGDA